MGPTPGGMMSFDRRTHLASASAKLNGEDIWAALCGDRAVMRDGVWQRLSFVNEAPSCKRCAKVDRAMRGGRLRVRLVGRSAEAAGSDPAQGGSTPSPAVPEVSP